MTQDEIAHWAIHPGGRKILEAVQDACGLVPSELEDSWNVLNDYGNMLAPSVMYVMQYQLERLRKQTIIEPEHGVAVSFSPGVRVEGIKFVY
eukprot:Pgem_evm1s4130